LIKKLKCIKGEFVLKHNGVFHGTQVQEKETERVLALKQWHLWVSGKILHNLMGSHYTSPI
jgi:hypothetical protein